MRLDRNINPDGRGKYALINLRTNKVEWGGPTAEEQFFVLKLKDEFAAPALRAYAEAVRTKAAEIEGSAEFGQTDAISRIRQCDSLREFAQDVEREAEHSEGCRERRIPD